MRSSNGNPRINGHGKGRNDSRNANSNSEAERQQGSYEVLISTRLMVISAICSILAAYLAGGLARVYLERKRSRVIVGPNEDLSQKKLEGGDEEQVSSSSFCQQVMIEWDHLRKDFLQSKQLLTNALVDTMSVLHEPKLSYYCHEKSGVTCVASFQAQGHVAFHSRPDVGVLTLDLLYCQQEEGTLFELLEHTAETFGQYSQQPYGGLGDAGTRPFHAALNVHWGIKRRRSLSDEGSDLRNDLEDMYTSLKHVKMHVETNFQDITILERVDLRDEILGHHLESITGSGDSYQSQHPELYLKEKTVYMSGAMQSGNSGDAAYHESLVHPALFAHNKPKRVAIIGGGEGATLREVLKHATVENAIMVEIDAQMMSASREHLPEWSNCSPLVNSTVSCFDEPRASVYAEDALAWFIDRFHGNEDKKANAKGLDNAEPMDVIIMDALDPQDPSEFCNVLYNHDTFFKALYQALTEKGILVVQLGEAPELLDAPDSLTMHSKRANLMDELERVGFVSLHVYDDQLHSDFLGVWTYLVAFKDWDSRAKWYANEAEIELEIKKRAMQTKTGKTPFVYFDGSTMLSNQIPHKVYETAYRNEHPEHRSCNELAGFDPNIPVIPLSDLEVKLSGQGDHSGRGVFTKVDIPANSYIAIDAGVDQAFFSPKTTSLIYQMKDKVEEAQALKALVYYMDGYGFESDYNGEVEVNVDTCAITFVNHGCNGTFNIGSEFDHLYTENSVDPDEMPAEWHDVDKTLYNPCLDRQIGRVNSCGDKSLRDIRAGEELLSNYLGFHVDPKSWTQYIHDLRAECAGEKIGDVSAYESIETD